MENHAAALGAALEQVVAAALARFGGERTAVLYSAGVDSAVLAKICQDAGHAPLLLSLGTTESKDREFVERSRPHLELPIQFVTISEGEIIDALPATQELLEETGILPDPMHHSLGVATYLACEEAQRRGIKLLLSGQGADSLLAGFDKYRDMSPERLSTILEMYVQNAIRSGLPRDRAITTSFSIEFVAPFLEPSVVKLALEIPTEFKLGGTGNKLVLRELARQRGLPEFIARRPKKAMQYSTGIWRVVQGVIGS